MEGTRNEKENGHSRVITLCAKRDDGSIECGKCQGSMISIYNYSSSGVWVVLKCVNCGNELDPTIVRNRIRPLPVIKQHKNLRWGV